ncbi:hypothetical protein EYF80_018595 [Liparis tanakae]|uniref:Uncharacterized protein n=1 Tax=Liparis tanakae TaxID=230148 RepID=A0A4Z2HZV4_9TELE|nr:hypothetical protein EYF80_018595 [Liparis tanakae]
MNSIPVQPFFMTLSCPLWDMIRAEDEDTDPLHTCMSSHSEQQARRDLSPAMSISCSLIRWSRILATVRNGPSQLSEKDNHGFVDVAVHGFRYAHPPRGVCPRIDQNLSLFDSTP